MAGKNIMIVGVGGQGTLLTSRILGGLAIENGYVTVNMWRSRLWKKVRRMY